MVPSDRSALTQWWSTTYPAVGDLADGVDDISRALQQLDSGVLTAAAGDAHAASRMCLSALDRVNRNITPSGEVGSRDGRTRARLVGSRDALRG